MNASEMAGGFHPQRGEKLVMLFCNSNFAVVHATIVTHKTAGKQWDYRPVISVKKRRI